MTINTLKTYKLVFLHSKIYRETQLKTYIHLSLIKQTCKKQLLKRKFE